MTNLAKAHPRSRITRAPVFQALIIAFAFVITPLVIHSQSGRQKPPASEGASNNNTRPRQISKPAGQQSKSQPAKSSGKEDSPDDADDVVRVSSNLVAVPATVVDTRGVAVTNLKLEDFELRVDGQPNAISEISRADTPVRMAKHRRRQRIVVMPVAVAHVAAEQDRGVIQHRAVAFRHGIELSREVGELAQMEA